MGNWNSGFVKLGIIWAERDDALKMNVLVCYSSNLINDKMFILFTKPSLELSLDNLAQQIYYNAILERIINDDVIFFRYSKIR